MFTFQILRDGTVTNIQMTTSSGNRSVDDSARRAILNSSPASPLPSNYSGSIVTVEFWFGFEGKNALQEARVNGARLPRARAYFFKSAKDCVPLELGMMILVGRG